jgi:hypothetical protein
MRSHQLSLLTRNTNALIRATSELARSAHLGPWLATLHALAEADLLLFRHRAPEAVLAYERVLDVKVLPNNSFIVLAYAMYARALCESGRPARAVRLCEEILLRFDSGREAVGMHGKRLLEQQLALAQAELGLFAESCARLDALLASASAESHDNPLTLGALHRDRALVALSMQDAAHFEHSFAEMKRWFGTTQNPWLIEQCDALSLRAEGAGVGRPLRARGQASAASGDDDLDGTTVVGSDRTDVLDTVPRPHRR